MNQPQPSLQWDVFCRVIDNFGDIGVCWRLVTQLAGQGQQRLFDRNRISAFDVHHHSNRRIVRPR